MARVMPSRAAMRSRALLLIVASTCPSCLLEPDSMRDSVSVDPPAGITPELLAQARSRVAQAGGIDEARLAAYGPADRPVEDRFVDAVVVEYEQHPEALRRRLEVLADMAIPDAPTEGGTNPFAGMDREAFERYRQNEAETQPTVTVNGPPPSVCETKFLIAVSRGQVGSPSFVEGGLITNARAYRAAYAAHRASCSGEDANTWYAFHGETALRPISYESELGGLVADRMRACGASELDAARATECGRYRADRLTYRRAKATEVALRSLVYGDDSAPPVRRSSPAPANPTQHEYLGDGLEPAVFVEDRNGDGVGELVAARADLLHRDGAMLRLDPGTAVPLPEATTVTLAEAAVVLVRDETGYSVPRRIEAGTVLQLSADAAIVAAETVLYAVGGALLELPAGMRASLPAGLAAATADGLAIRVPGPEDLFDRGGTPGEVRVRLDAAVSVPIAARDPLLLTLSADSLWPHLTAEVETVEGPIVALHVAATDTLAYEPVLPGWDPSFARRPDLGIAALLPANGCQDTPYCPLSRRIATLVERHAMRKKSYASLAPDDSAVSDRAWAMVGGQATVREAGYHAEGPDPQWGGGRVVYFARVPYSALLADRVGTAPTLALVSVVARPDLVDFGATWFDVQSLLHGYRTSHHESNFTMLAAAPAHLLEGAISLPEPQ